MAKASAKKYRVLVPLYCYNVTDAKRVGEALCNSGFEVIYTDPPDPKGPRGLEFPSEIAVDAALQENADAICIFTVVYADLAFLQTLGVMTKKEVKDVLLLGGGLVASDDADELSKRGAGRLFDSGTPMSDVVKYLREEIPRRRSTRS